MSKNEKLIKELDRIDKTLRKKLSGFEYKLLLEYKTALRNVQLMLAEVYAKLGNDVKFSDMMKYNRLGNLEKQITEEIKRILKQSINITSTLLKETYTENYYKTAEVHGNVWSLSITIPELDTDAIEESIKNPYDRVGWKFRAKGNHEKTIQQIKSEITQGLIQGKGYRKTAAEIKNKFTNLANNQLRIVRTESHRVQILGRMRGIETAEKSAERIGLKLVRKWKATKDDRTRDSHTKMDGQIAKLIDGELRFTFPSGATTIGPGLSGIAEEDINCRCSIITELSK